MKQMVCFNAGSGMLSGDFTGSPENCRTLFLHGAGHSTRERQRYLRDSLWRRGMSSFAFDHSGHGDSRGSLARSSLRTRHEEAKAAISQMGGARPLVVSGSSMGGHLAIRLTTEFEVSTLLLFCPAIYAAAAYSVPFHQGFSDIIRERNSWLDSEALPALRKFTGNLLLYIGTEDDVIPAQVVERIREAAQMARHTSIVRLPGVGHSIHAWLRANDQVTESIVDRLLELESSS